MFDTMIFITVDVSQDKHITRKYLSIHVDLVCLGELCDRSPALISESQPHVQTQ